MTGDYPSAEGVFADADAKIDLGRALLARAAPVAESDAAWTYWTKTRRLPPDVVRGAVDQLRLVTPPIPGRDPQDYGCASLLRDSSGEVSGIELAFIDCAGAPALKEPHRQTYAVRPGGVKVALFHAGGPETGLALLAEGRAAKPLALVATELGRCYGGGARTVLGCAAPAEKQITIVTDRRPDGEDGEAHDRDYKRAADLLLIEGAGVSITPDPPCSCCKDADQVLHRHGPIRLADWVRQATPVGLSTDGEARKLAAVKDPLERDRLTSEAAKRLKVRVGVLREAVRRHHDGEAGADEPATAGSAVVFDELKPAAEPQDGARLLDDVAGAIRRHAFLAEADRVKAVLWAVHGHRRLLGNVTVLPRLIVTAAGEDSGKTTLAVVLAKLGDRFEHTVDPTSAVLFRAIEAEQAGFMLDEADAWWRADDALRSIVNSGFTLEGASVLRVEDTGDGRGRRVLAPRRFSTFAPLAVVGIKLDQVLPRTLISRSLVIQMRPARVGEVPADLLGERSAVGRLRTLAGRVQRWVADNELALSVAVPKLPRTLVNRIKLVWRPLLAIADQAGGDWPRLAREALEVDRGLVRDPTLGEQMLLDVRDILETHGHEFADGDRAMHTADLISELLQTELRSWPVYGSARAAIRDLDVARLLAPYEVRPRQIKIGSLNRNGYRLKDIAAAATRYVVTSAPLAESPYYPTEPPEPRESAAHEVDPAVGGRGPGVSTGFDGRGSEPSTPYQAPTVESRSQPETQDFGRGVAGFRPGYPRHSTDDTTETCAGEGDDDDAQGGTDGNARGQESRGAGNGAGDPAAGGGWVEGDPSQVGASQEPGLGFSVFGSDAVPAERAGRGRDQDLAAGGNPAGAGNPDAYRAFLTCSTCNGLFPRPPRGRPPHRCPACRGNSDGRDEDPPIRGAGSGLRWEFRG
jgi:hypothetical protein